MNLSANFLKGDITFVLMPYNRNNKQREINYIMSVYKSVKETDIPDTFIVSKIFPKHNIFICYNTFMTYKGMKPSEYKQPSLFDQQSAQQQAERSILRAAV